MAEKMTIMKLKVDLECEKCYKKVKKLLAKYPQIRGQKFDEKQSSVFITVVCCSPEKLRDKLCCKGGGSIKSIEILEPPKSKPPEQEKKKEADKAKAAEPEKKKEADKQKPKTDGEKPKPASEPEKKKDGEKPKQDGTKKEADKPKDEPAKPKVKPPEPIPAPPQVPMVPPPMAVPVGICCVPCYEGRPGGPCMNGYVGPPVCYDGYYGRPVYDSYGGGRPYYVSRCDQYFSEENPSGCTVM